MEVVIFAQEGHEVEGSVLVPSFCNSYCTWLNYETEEVASMARGVVGVVDASV
jgi:hypothetical protein